jgi:hypothetical protein
MNALADRRMGNFMMLSDSERVEAIQKMAGSGLSPYTISAATGIAVEQIRTIVGVQRPEECEACE